MTKTLIELQVNGEVYSLAVKPNDTLLEALRDHLGLVGTKEGCSVGECGACTVRLNGDAVSLTELAVVFGFLSVGIGFGFPSRI